MIIYLIQSLIWTLVSKTKESKIELYFDKVFYQNKTLVIRSGAVKCYHGNWRWRAENCILIPIV